MKTKRLRLVFFVIPQPAFYFIHGVYKWSPYFFGKRIVSIHVHKQLPGVVLNNLQYMEQPFVTFRFCY